MGTNFGGCYVLLGNYTMKIQVNVPTPNVTFYTTHPAETIFVLLSVKDPVCIEDIHSAVMYGEYKNKGDFLSDFQVH